MALHIGGGAIKSFLASSVAFISVTKPPLKYCKSGKSLFVFQDHRHVLVLPNESYSQIDKAAVVKLWFML